MAPSFAQGFRDFLCKEENKALLQEAICGPLLDEVRALRMECKKKNEVIDTLTNEVTTLKATIASLEASHDDLEQYQRRNSLRITGITEPTGTQQEDCMATALHVVNTTLKLDPPVQPRDIDRAHRIGRGNSRQLLVKFATYHQRRRVFEARKGLYTSGNTIFVNEDLTKTRATILYAARSAKRDGKLKECWSSDGRLFIRLLDSTKHLVRTMTELKDHLPTGYEPKA